MIENNLVVSSLVSYMMFVSYKPGYYMEQNKLALALAAQFALVVVVMVVQSVLVVAVKLVDLRRHIPHNHMHMLVWMMALDKR
jgi:hypothetical protein